MFDVVRNLCAAHADDSTARNPWSSSLTRVRSTSTTQGSCGSTTAGTAPASGSRSTRCTRTMSTASSGCRAHIAPGSFIPAVEAVSHESPPSRRRPRWPPRDPVARVLAAAQTRTLVVLWVHVRLSRSYGKLELRRLLRNADGLIFPSDDLKRSVEARVGSLPTPSVVIHNGIATSIFLQRWTESDAAFRVTYVGEVASHKGVHMLLEAMRHSLLSKRSTATTDGRRFKSLARARPVEPLRVLVARFGGQLGLDVRWIPRVPQAELGVDFSRQRRRLRAVRLRTRRSAWWFWRLSHAARSSWHPREAVCRRPAETLRPTSTRRTNRLRRPPSLDSPTTNDFSRRCVGEQRHECADASWDTAYEQFQTRRRTLPGREADWRAHRREAATRARHLTSRRLQNAMSGMRKKTNSSRVRLHAQSRESPARDSRLCVGCYPAGDDDIEILVVDNASSDDTPDVIAAAAVAIGVFGTSSSPILASLARETPPSPRSRIDHRVHRRRCATADRVAGGADETDRRRERRTPSRVA